MPSKRGKRPRDNQNTCAALPDNDLPGGKRRPLRVPSCQSTDTASGTDDQQVAPCRLWNVDQDISSKPSPVTCVASRPVQPSTAPARTSLAAPLPSCQHEHAPGRQWPASTRETSQRDARGEWRSVSPPAQPSSCPAQTSLAASRRQWTASTCKNSQQAPTDARSRDDVLPSSTAYMDPESTLYHRRQHELAVLEYGDNPAQLSRILHSLVELCYNSCDLQSIIVHGDHQAADQPPFNISAPRAQKALKQTEALGFNLSLIHI